MIEHQSLDSEGRSRPRLIFSFKLIYRYTITHTSKLTQRADGWTGVAFFFFGPPLSLKLLMSVSEISKGGYIYTYGKSEMRNENEIKNNDKNDLE